MMESIKTKSKSTKSIVIIKTKINMTIVVEEKVKNKLLRIKRKPILYRNNRLNKINHIKKIEAAKFIIKNQLKILKIRNIKLKIMLIKNTKELRKRMVIKNQSTKKLNNKLTILFRMYWKRLRRLINLLII